jgi:hypothetical protein
VIRWGSVLCTGPNHPTQLHISVLPIDGVVGYRRVQMRALLLRTSTLLRHSSRTPKRRWPTGLTHAGTLVVALKVGCANGRGGAPSLNPSGVAFYAVRTYCLSACRIFSLREFGRGHEGIFAGRKRTQLHCQPSRNRVLCRDVVLKITAMTPMGASMAECSVPTGTCTAWCCVSMPLLLMVMMTV